MSASGIPAFKTSATSKPTMGGLGCFASFGLVVRVRSTFLSGLPTNMPDVRVMGIGAGEPAFRQLCRNGTLSGISDRATKQMA